MLKVGQKGAVRRRVETPEEAAEKLHRAKSTDFLRMLGIMVYDGLMVHMNMHLGVLRVVLTSQICIRFLFPYGVLCTIIIHRHTYSLRSKVLGFQLTAHGRSDSTSTYLHYYNIF